MSSDEPSFPRHTARTQRFTLGMPRNFAVAPDGSRVAFLRSHSGSDRVTMLWVGDLPADGPLAERVVADPRALFDGTEELSPAEQARRERSREGAGGIVGFATDKAVTTAAFALSGGLYVADLVADAGVRALDVVGPVVDPRLDPTGRCGGLRERGGPAGRRRGRHRRPGTARPARRDGRVLGPRRVRRGGGDGALPRVLVGAGRLGAARRARRQRARPALARRGPRAAGQAAGRACLPGRRDAQRPRRAAPVRSRRGRPARGHLGRRGVPVPRLRALVGGRTAAAARAVPQPALDADPVGRRRDRRHRPRPRRRRPGLGRARRRGPGLGARRAARAGRGRRRGAPAVRRPGHGLWRPAGAGRRLGGRLWGRRRGRRPGRRRGRPVHRVRGGAHGDRTSTGRAPPARCACRTGRVCTPASGPGRSPSSSRPRSAGSAAASRCCARAPSTPWRPHAETPRVLPARADAAGRAPRGPHRAAAADRPRAGVRSAAGADGPVRRAARAARPVGAQRVPGGAVVGRPGFRRRRRGRPRHPGPRPRVGARDLRRPRHPRPGGPGRGAARGRRRVPRT